MKPDYVICVGGTPGFGWLSMPSDEQDANTLVVTTDPDLVLRYSSPAEAMPDFERLKNAHTNRRFSMMSINPLESEA